MTKTSKKFAEIDEVTLKEYAKLKQELDCALAANAKLAKELNMSEDNVRSLSEQIKHNWDEIGTLKERVAGVLDTNSKMDTTLMEQDEIIRQLEAERDRAFSRIGVFADKADRLQEELHRWKQRAEAAETKNIKAVFDPKSEGDDPLIVKASRIINDMCLTWRHDFPLMKAEQREAFRSQMAQVFEHNVLPLLKVQPAAATRGEILDAVPNLTAPVDTAYEVMKHIGWDLRQIAEEFDDNAEYPTLNARIMREAASVLDGWPVKAAHKDVLKVERDMQGKTEPAYDVARRAC